MEEEERGSMHVKFLQLKRINRNEQKENFTANYEDTKEENSISLTF